MTGHLEDFDVLDHDNHVTAIGSGYRIGDNYVLTAGHVFFE